MSKFMIPAESPSLAINVDAIQHLEASSSSFPVDGVGFEPRIYASIINSGEIKLWRGAERFASYEEAKAFAQAYLQKLLAEMSPQQATPPIKIKINWVKEGDLVLFLGVLVPHPALPMGALEMSEISLGDGKRQGLYLYVLEEEQEGWEEKTTYVGRVSGWWVLSIENEFDSASDAREWCEQEAVKIMSEMHAALGRVLGASG